MGKISSAEQAHRETVELWEQIEEICEDERNHYISGIKNDIIGERYYVSDCPLCEYYWDNRKNCPLSAGYDDCRHGCDTYGFWHYMSKKKIKKFLGVLKEKLEVE